MHPSFVLLSFVFLPTLLWACTPVNQNAAGAAAGKVSVSMEIIGKTVAKIEAALDSVSLPKTGTSNPAAFDSTFFAYTLPITEVCSKARADGALMAKEDMIAFVTVTCEGQSPNTYAHV